MNGIPILGRGPNERAIKILEGMLESMKKGELINVCVVAEQRHDGQVITAFDVSPANGEAIKMCGGLGFVAASINQKLIPR